MITGVPPTEHLGPLFVKFKILKLQQLVHYTVGVFMYKLFLQIYLKYGCLIANAETPYHNTCQNITPIVMLLKPIGKAWKCNTNIDYATPY